MRATCAGLAAPLGLLPCLVCLLCLLLARLELLTAWGTRPPPAITPKTTSRASGSNQNRLDKAARSTTHPVRGTTAAICLTRGQSDEKTKTHHHRWTTSARASVLETFGGRSRRTKEPSKHPASTPLRAAVMGSAEEGDRATPQAPSSSRPRFLTPLLDFAQPTTLDLIDRLDDVIMGGISTSAVVWRNDSTLSGRQPYAQWFGVCREDGGGFCGWRTNPFRQALQVVEDGSGGGLYVTARLSSDTDLHRRVWKLSTRTRPDRGEQLYQASIPLAQSHPDAEGWVTALVPFDRFQLVRGPRTVVGAPPLNVTTTGLHQIGMTMSKFVLGNVTRQLENFRPGFFALDVKEIGVYSSHTQPPATKADAALGIEQKSSDVPAARSVPQQNGTLLAASQVLTKAESERRRPWLVQRLLLPFLQLIFFSERSQRRKAAFRILTTHRGLSPWQAAVWGWKRRRQQSSRGLLPALRTTATIAAADLLRFTSSVVLRITLVYPLKLVTAPFRWWVQRQKSNGSTTSVTTDP